MKSIELYLQLSRLVGRALIVDREVVEEIIKLVDSNIELYTPEAERIIALYRPDVAEKLTVRYARHVLKTKLGVDVGERGRGFTDAVLKVLGWDSLPEDYVTTDIKPPCAYARLGGTVSGIITGRQLLEIVKYMPDWNLAERHNEAPSFIRFVEAALEHPGCMFQIYIVEKWRDDERVCITGAYIPDNRYDIVDMLLRAALDLPDAVRTAHINDKCYIYLWWD